MEQPISNGKFHKTLPYREAHQLNAVKRTYFTIIFSREMTPTVMNWRCHNCGKIVFQYYNHPKAAFDGAINVADIDKPTDHQCEKCNIIFRIT